MSAKFCEKQKVFNVRRQIQIFVIGNSVTTNGIESQTESNKYV